MWMMTGIYIALFFVILFQGNEGFMMDIEELIKNWLLEKRLV